MSGQQVVRLFCCEDVTQQEFDAINEVTCQIQEEAQFSGGILEPVLVNLCRCVYAITSLIGGLPQEVVECQELVDLFLPIMRADVRLEEGSHASEPQTIDCNLSVLYSTRDDEGGQMDQWRRCAGLLCDFHRFEGTHFFMVDHCAEVAEIINRTL